MRTIVGLFVTAALAIATLPARGQEAGSPPTQVSRPEGAVAPEGRVAEASFTTGIVDRAPVDTITTLSDDRRKIFYFTDVRDMTGQTVTHRWEFNDQVMAEVPFEIRGPRWRIYSSKTLEPVWLGEWRASTVDASGRVLSSNTFSYTRAAPQARFPQPDESGGSAPASGGSVPDPVAPASPEE